MKKYLISLLVVFAFTGCSKETKVMEETYPNGSPKRESVYKVKDASRELIRETTWYPNKKLQMVGEFKEKRRDGKWIYYYENGNIWSEGFFKNGKSDGPRILYYENGKIYIEGHYKDDRQVGIWKYYNDKGILLRTDDLDKVTPKGQKPIK